MKTKIGFISVITAVLLIGTDECSSARQISKEDRKYVQLYKNYFDKGITARKKEDLQRIDRLKSDLHEQPLETILLSKKLDYLYRLWIRPDYGKGSVCIRVEGVFGKPAKLIVKQSQMIQKDWASEDVRVAPADFLLKSKLKSIEKRTLNSAETKEFLKLIIQEKFWQITPKEHYESTKDIQCRSYRWKLEGAKKNSYQSLYSTNPKSGAVRKIGSYVLRKSNLSAENLDLF